MRTSLDLFWVLVLGLSSNRNECLLVAQRFTSGADGELTTHVTWWRSASLLEVIRNWAHVVVAGVTQREAGLSHVKCWWLWKGCNVERLGLVSRIEEMDFSHS
mmetsp:Transcript_40037/g.62489  ORF Transcript_40037/g.62489 Transcript_40037/m.62489 type:complete len:103 (+) Transcript_40037:731-1039(+)